MKKYFWLFAIAISLIITGVLIYFFEFRGPEEESAPQVPEREMTLEEALKSVTAPEDGSEVSEKILKGLTAPKKGNPDVPEEILDSLTAPSGKH